MCVCVCVCVCGLRDYSLRLRALEDVKEFLVEEEEKLNVSFFKPPLICASSLCSFLFRYLVPPLFDAVFEITICILFFKEFHCTEHTHMGTENMVHQTATHTHTPHPPPHLSEDKLLLLRDWQVGFPAQVHRQVGGDSVPHSAPCWLPGVIAELPLCGGLKELGRGRNQG